MAVNKLRFGVCRLLQNHWILTHSYHFKRFVPALLWRTSEIPWYFLFQHGGDRWTFSTTFPDPFTPTYVNSNLSLCSDPMGMYNTRVKGRQILLANPARDSRMKKELEEKRAQKKRERDRKKFGVMAKLEARERGLWRLHENQTKWGSRVLFLTEF